MLPRDERTFTVLRTDPSDEEEKRVEAVIQLKAGVSPACATVSAARLPASVAPA